MERYLTWGMVLICGLMGLVEGLPAPEDTSSSGGPTSTSDAANSSAPASSPSASSQPASSTPTTYFLRQSLI